MKYKDVGFRAVYKQFCAFPLGESIISIASDFPGMDEANCALCYGYIDHEAGLTLDIIAGGIQDGESFRFADTATDINAIVRIGAVSEEDFFIIEDPDGSLKERYADKLDMLATYDVSEDIEKTREMFFLDGQRHEENIDDVLVYLMRDGLKPEGCWTRICGLGDHWFMGTLLNEPDQDFGYHMGEEIGFYVHQQEDESFICYSDMTPDKELKVEDLEDGSLLEEAVRLFHENRTEDTFFEVIQLLRDSYVWIPCSMVLSERDQKKWEEIIQNAGDDTDSLVGMTLTNEDEVRMVPDILQNGDDFFFPVFSTAEAMGEYGNGFSKIQKHFLEALALAKNNEKNVKGIVLNAFTEEFILERVLFDTFDKIKSRIISNNQDEA